MILLAMCLFSCTQKKENNNDMERLLKKYATDSLNIQNIIGQDMFYFPGSYKIKNGKLLVHGREAKLRFSENALNLIFIIDIKNKKLVSTVVDPVKDYIGLIYDMIDDSTLLITHTLTVDEIYLINIFSHKVEKRHIQFGETANNPGIIDANGRQLFMTQNVYGFAVANLITMEGKVFVNSSFSVLQSTVSYPIDEKLNLLSGTFENDSHNREIITLYAINKAGNIKWEKALPPIRYEDLDAFYFYNFGKNFIIKYHNTVECLDKADGKQIWDFTNEHPITKTYMVGNKLVVHSFFNSTRMIPSDDDERNKRMQEGYQEQISIIDLENGKVVWSKNFAGTYSKIGILGGNLIVYNNKKSFLITLKKSQEQTIELTMDLEHAGFDYTMDTKTGKLYLEYMGTIYW